MTRISMWTIYDHPRDFPNNYVAREWTVTAGKTVKTGNLMLASELEMLREVLLIQMNLHCISRSEGDDPVIVETWI